MKPQSIIIWAFLALFSVHSALGQTLSTVDIYFEKNSDLPIFESELTLDSLFSTANTNFDSYEILIETFPNTPKELRSERATFLADILDFQEINATKIVHYEDIEHLYFINDDIDDWDFIRLVFIPVILKQKEKSQANNDLVIDKNDESKGVIGIIQEYEENVIDGENAYELKLDGGTQINILPNSFQKANGELISGPVVIKAREILTKTQTILADITTNMGNGFLKSKGMIEVLAETPEGVPLQLVQGMSLGIKIPQSESIEGQGYGIYEGVPLENGQLDWRLTDNEIKEDRGPVRQYYSWEPIAAHVLDSMTQARRSFSNKIDSLYGKKGKRYNKKKLEYYERFLNSAKWSVKNANKKRKRGQGQSTIRGSDLSKIKWWMVLGKAKYKLEFDSLKTAEGYANRMERSSDIMIFSRFQIYNLGFCNVDKIVNVINSTTVVVNTKGNNEVRLLMKDQFSYLRGEKKKNKVVFNRVSKNKQILIFQFEKLSDGKVSYGFLPSNTSKRVNEIEKSYVCSIEELEYKINEILEQFSLEDEMNDILN